MTPAPAGRAAPKLPPGFDLRPLGQDDDGELRALWSFESSPGRLGLSAADEPEAMTAFLARTPSFSMGVWDPEGRLVGAILAGEDGRRGYLYHLVVLPSLRRRGLGRLLVESVVHGLNRHGIGKVHAFVYAANEEGRRFWHALGFVERDELVVASIETPSIGPGSAPRPGQTADE